MAKKKKGMPASAPASMPRGSRMMHAAPIDGTKKVKMPSMRKKKK